MARPSGRNLSRDELDQAPSGGLCGLFPNPGRDQAFPGVATRITGADDVASFLIRDLQGRDHPDAPSGLRIGADYSWDRGARALIRGHLLDGS